MAVEFSEAAKQEFQEILKHYPTKEAAMLPTLHLAKREFDHISPEVMTYISQLLDLHVTRVANVVSFYTLFPREPEGKYVIQVCSTLSCQLMGAETVVDHIKEKLNIDVGETTPDGKFTLKKVECLGSCGTAPVMQINDDYYEKLTVEKIDKILDSLE